MAFSILAVALTLVLRIFGSGVNAAVVSEEYSLAVQIAESLMARTGVETPLQSGETSGTEADKYDWSVSVSPVITPRSRTGKLQSASDEETQQAQLQLFAVKVRVVWGDAEDKQRSLVLNSLKLMQEREEDL